MDNQLPGSQTSTPILVFPTPLLSGAADISHPILHMVVERVPHKLPFVTVIRVSCVYTFVCLSVCLSVCLCLCVCVRVFDKNFCSVPNWLKSYMATVPQSTMMGQSYSISIEGLNHIAPKWSYRSSKVGYLVFSLG